MGFGVSGGHFSPKSDSLATESSPQEKLRKRLCFREIWREKKEV